FLLVPRAGSLYARIAYFATSFDQGSNNNLNTALTHNQAMIGGPLNLSLKDNILALRDFIKLRADQGASMLIDLIDLRTIMGGNTALMNSAVQFKNLIDNRPITTSILAALSNLQNAIAGNNAFDLVTRTNQYVNILYTNSNPRNLGTAILALQTKLGGNGDIYSRIDLLQINFQLLTTENLNAKNSIGTLLPPPANPSLLERLNEINVLVPGAAPIVRKVQALKNDFDADELAIAQAKTMVGTLQPIPADPILADRLAELNPFLPAGGDPIVRKVQILKNEYDNVKNDLDEAENTINDAWQTADGQSSADLTTGLHTISALVGNAVILTGVNALNTQIQDSKNSLGTLLPSPADPSLSERLDEVNTLVPGPAPIVQKVQALKDDFDADELVIAQAKTSVGTLQPIPADPILADRLAELNPFLPAGGDPIVRKVQILRNEYDNVKNDLDEAEN
ncbi:hypothetical protein, partial [Candidatus Paracaedibacter symbiosus]|uniref:hypothetical protein n=1 Tax=Candidatus Paracaedibacter symbiosus TaxID=244582 RepID=UPI0005094ADA